MEIKCDFQDMKWVFFGPLYTCKISSASITEPNQEIKSLIGEHQPEKTYQNVEAIYFDHTEVHYMPKNLHKIFPNLKVVQIIECGLKEITQENLFGLENISAIYFDYNKLKTLPDDLFEGMKKLKRISFSDNKLEYFSPQLFKPILGNQLIFVDLLDNPKIDVIFDSAEPNPSDNHVTLSELLKIIEENCDEPPKDEIETKPSTSNELPEEFRENFLKGFKDFWTSGEFADFTIIAGGKNFPVHKAVLSLQSEFFKELFKKTEINSIAELKIEALSAEAVEEVLRWMYTGQIPGIKNAIEVFVLAMKLKITHLRKIAEDLVLQIADQEIVEETVGDEFEIDYNQMY